MSALYVYWTKANTTSEANSSPLINKHQQQHTPSSDLESVQSFSLYWFKQHPNKAISSLLLCTSAPKSSFWNRRAGSEHSLPSLQRVANQQGLLATYLPSYRHTWFQLGVCTYKQLAMAAYWSGSAMLTASQDRHKLLMNDIHSCSRAVTTQFRLEVFRGRQRSDSELFGAVNRLKAASHHLRREK